MGKERIVKMKGFLKGVVALVAMLFVIGLWLEESMAWGGGGGGGRGGGGRGGWGRGGAGPRGGFGKFGGGKGKRDESLTDRKDVAKDLEQRRLQDEKEARIRDVRDAGAGTAFDEMQSRILEKEREKAAAQRRADWRGLANPG